MKLNLKLNEVNMDKLLEMLLANLKEPSTYRGLGMMAIALGAPEGSLDHFVQVGIFIIGLLGLIPDHFIKDLFSGKKVDTTELITEIVTNQLASLNLKQSKAKVKAAAEPAPETPQV